MQQFTNPLNSVRIASPCSSDWSAMYGGERKRFCAECNLNVYNLSDMTREEAEDLLIKSEGRLCIRFFRRVDGTVMTKDCPIGWRAVKKRAFMVATALSSLVMGFFSGVLATRSTEAAILALPIGNVPIPESYTERRMAVAVVGEVEDIAGQVQHTDLRRAMLGRVENKEKMDEKGIVAWVK